MTESSKYRDRSINDVYYSILIFSQFISLKNNKFVPKYKSLF